MGVFNALTTAVAGMQAQSYALENISGNIANARTTGFKRVDTGFADLVPDTSLNRQFAGSVRAFSRATNTLQGDTLPTGIGTNAAINGDGYFVVDSRTNGLGSTTSFSGSNLYTRRGDFDFDSNGYLVNGSGYYLKGFSINRETGTVVGTKPEVIQISHQAFPAKKTTKVEYQANLPAFPLTERAKNNPTLADRELLDAALAGGDITTAQSDEFIAQSLPGGSVTVYDSLGQAVNVEMRWAKIANTGTSSTWQLYVKNTNTATGVPAYLRVNQPASAITFDDKGKMTAPADGTMTLPDLTVGGATLTGIKFSMANNGVTQYGDTSGQIDARSVKQDGYSAGTLEGVQIGDNGRVVGTFSNGQVLALAQVAIAQFNAPNALKRLDGGAMEQTMESGEAVMSMGNSQLIGGAVEQSNTDIADEFSKMIVTQQAYSANTKVISTSQDMLTAVFNIIR